MKKKALKNFMSLFYVDNRKYLNPHQAEVSESLIIVHYLAPLTILKHFLGYCGTLSGLKGPSWTLMDPQMDPKLDPARLISGHPW